MTKQNKCPTCREKIEREEPRNNGEKPSSENTQSTQNTQNTFTRNLVNIQTVLHPELSYLDYNYNNSFSWAKKPSASSSTGSSYSSSWGRKSGGSSSKW